MTEKNLLRAYHGYYHHRLSWLPCETSCEVVASSVSNIVDMRRTGGTGHDRALPRWLPPHARLVMVCT